MGTKVRIICVVPEDCPEEKEPMTHHKRRLDSKGKAMVARRRARQRHMEWDELMMYSQPS